MKVFISWSGKTGRHVAEALRDWLPYLIRDIEPWMSSVDMQPGSRWNTEIAAQLEQTHYGIICLTKESLVAPWLIFEAGALAKTVEKARVIPYLVDIKPTHLEGPLVQFQAISADKEATWRLVNSFNEDFSAKKTQKDRLQRTFEKFWPDLEQALGALPATSETAGDIRSDRSILEEVLGAIRLLAKRLDKLDHRTELLADVYDIANAEQRLKDYAKSYDNVYNIEWDPMKRHFDIEQNGSSDWPSENPCDNKVLEKLARPWPTYIWYSD